MKRTLFVANVGSLVLVAGLFLAGCAGSNGDSSMAPDDGGVVSPGVALAPGSSGEIARDQAPAPVERKEVVTGQVYIRADDPIAAARETVRVVEASGGRVDNRTETPENGDVPASSSLTVRIPADELTGALDEIQALGDVTSTSISRDDVTMQYQDLDARIAALQASVTRLQALIAGASNTADLIEAESALSSRQGELDSLISQRNYLSGQVDLSTITVQFDTEAMASEPGADSFWDGVVSGAKALVAFVAGALVVIGAVLPWVAVLLAIALIVYGVMRVLRRRSTAGAGSTAGGDEK